MRQNANVKQYSGVYNILCIGDFLKCVIGALLAVVQNSPSDLLDSVLKKIRMVRFRSRFMRTVG